MSKEDILKKLKDSVINMDCDAAKEAALEALDAKIDPSKAIKKGLYAGLKEICDEYEITVFPTELLIASDAFYEGVKVLRSKISAEKASEMRKGIAILGVVEGDIHDLGKNMVKYLMEAEGIEIHDLGFDVTAEKFVEEAEKTNADLILISTMLTSLFPEIKKISTLAKDKGLNVRIMAGGGPVTEEIALKMGADGWALTAPLAVKKAVELLEKPLEKPMKVAKT
ncbi:MAG: cobalamin B12-binding domain-containing protein [Candidatus Helarchaeota archaeon]|nr:cobalamin B12-binding domain-containing protein [Candidatus Helarchaeota archaeon]